MTMTMYQGRQAISRKRKIWPWVTIVLIVIGLCGACGGLVAAFGLLKADDELVSSTVPVDSSAGVGQPVWRVVEPGADNERLRELAGLLA